MEFISRTKAAKQVGVNYLAKVNSSPKIMKNAKVYNVDTYGLYLAPHKLSGYNVCKASTPECRMGCLFASGQGRMNNDVPKARINRTKLFHENNRFFMEWMITEIKAAYDLAMKKGHKFSVRLNCTSDIDWVNTKYNGLNIFEIFPEISFYDYTKDANRFNNKPANYHLTYSYTGRNKTKALELLSRGFNIAVVFNTKELPESLWGYKVTDGDLADLRIKDESGVIVGLKFKMIKDREAEKYVKKSVFCVQPEEIEVENLVSVI